MPWGVNNIDSMLIELLRRTRPESGRGSRGNRYATLLFLLHPIHCGSAVMDLANLVGHTGIEQNPLRGRGLTRVHMSDNSDITITTNRC